LYREFPARSSDWCALQEALYKCIDTIQYNTIRTIYKAYARPIQNIAVGIGEYTIHMHKTKSSAL